MKVTIVQYKVKKEKVMENEDELKKVFEALKKAKLDDFRYASMKLSDGVSFIALVQFEGESNPFVQSEAFQNFQKRLTTRLDGQPIQEVAEIVGSYNFFD